MRASLLNSWRTRRAASPLAARAHAGAPCARPRKLRKPSHAGAPCTGPMARRHGHANAPSAGAPSAAAPGPTNTATAAVIACAASLNSSNAQLQLRHSVLAVPTPRGISEEERRAGSSMPRSSCRYRAQAQRLRFQCPQQLHLLRRQQCLLQLLQLSTSRRMRTRRPTASWLLSWRPTQLRGRKPTRTIPKRSRSTSCMPMQPPPMRSMCQWSMRSHRFRPAASLCCLPAVGWHSC